MIPYRESIFCGITITLWPNKNGYLSCTFVLSMLAIGTEQRYKNVEDV